MVPGACEGAEKGMILDLLGGKHRVDDAVLVEGAFAGGVAHVAKVFALWLDFSTQEFRVYLIN
jgi:hypothetical protein